MSRAFLTLYSAVLGLLIANSELALGQNAPAGRPLVCLSGIDSQIDKESYLLIASAAEWAELWSRHAGDDTRTLLPEVDFDQCMVIAVFSGKTVHCRGIEAVTLLEDAHAIRLRFEPLTYQTTDAHDDRPVVPYGFFVVRQTKKTVAVEKGVRQYLGMPPNWKLVATFAEKPPRP